MATTTNYGWTTPDDTALVKDGAAAIRTLGSSVDTTTKNLNPSTTLGDIEYRSSTANTNTRLGIGTTGQILTVTGGVPAWGAAPTAGGMTLISTTTLTGASVTLSSIPQTYKDLKLVIRNFLPTTNSAAFQWRINGDSTSNRYTSQFGTFALNTAFSQSSNNIGYANSSSVGTGILDIQFFDYTNTTTWKMMICTELDVDPTNTANFAYAPAGFNAYNQTSAISSLTLLATGGFTSGTALLYGVF